VVARPVQLLEELAETETNAFDLDLGLPAGCGRAGQTWSLTGNYRRTARARRGQPPGSRTLTPTRSVPGQVLLDVQRVGKNLIRPRWHCHRGRAFAATLPALTEAACACKYQADGIPQAMETSGVVERLMTDFDVVVVGAGPAGSTAARALAQGGARVCLVDKARFPRPKPCGGALSPRTLRHLPSGFEKIVRAHVRRASSRSVREAV
jgi:hypothetical protein